MAQMNALLHNEDANAAEILIEDFEVQNNLTHN